MQFFKAYDLLEVQHCFHLAAAVLVKPVENSYLFFHSQLRPLLLYCSLQQRTVRLLFLLRRHYDRRRCEFGGLVLETLRARLDAGVLCVLLC